MAEDKVQHDLPYGQEQPRICTHCNKPVDDVLFKFCSVCRAVMNRRGKARQGRMRKERRCTQCGRPADGSKQYCKECREKRNEKARKGRREIKRICLGCGTGPIDPRYQRCPDCRRKSTNESTRQWAARKIIEGICPQCCKRPLDGKTICLDCRTRAKGGRERQKRRCFSLYGDACVCCGETDLSFLTLDHINDDGAEKRRSGIYPGCGTGNALYGWILKNGKQDDLQIMCMSCQISKRILGVCAHKMRGIVRGDGEGI